TPRGGENWVCGLNRTYRVAKCKRAAVAATGCQRVRRWEEAANCSGGTVVARVPLLAAHHSMRAALAVLRRIHFEAAIGGASSAARHRCVIAITRQRSGRVANAR